MNQNTYCHLIQHGLAITARGTASPCCIFNGFITDQNNEEMYVQRSSVHSILNSEYMTSLRNNMLAGERAPQCASCWYDEDRGMESKRQRYNIPTSDPTNNNLSDLQLGLSNACNLACRTCGPAASSTWMSLEPGYRFSENGQAGRKSGVLWNTIDEWTSNLEILEVMGGEPFFVDQWTHVFNYLIDSGKSKNISLKLTTNCTIIDCHLIEKMIYNFKDVNVTISVDGLGDQFNYIRFPGDWEVVKDNIKKLVDLQRTVTSSEENRYMYMCVCCTVTWMGAWYLPELSAFFKDLGIQVWFNRLKGPAELAIENCPIAVKEQVLQKWKDADFFEIDLLTAINEPKRVNDEQIRNFLKKEDIRRNQPFSKFFPDLNFTV